MDHWTVEDFGNPQWIRSDPKIETLVRSERVRPHLAPEDQGDSPPRYLPRHLDLNRYLLMRIPPHVPEVQLRIWERRAAHVREQGENSAAIEKHDRICAILEDRESHGDLAWICAQTENHFYNFLVDLDAEVILESIWGHPLFTSEPDQ